MAQYTSINWRTKPTLSRSSEWRWTSMTGPKSYCWHATSTATEIFAIWLPCCGSNQTQEAFPPAGFDDEDEDDEILPWETGIWGVPVFGMTDKPGKFGKYEFGTQPGQSGQSGQPAQPVPTHKFKEPRLPRAMLLSGRHTRGLIALSGGRHGLINSLVAK